MKASIVLLAVVSLLLPTLAHARIGDNTVRTLARYGQSVASTNIPGKLTSTRTFHSGDIVVTCGYVKDKVEMISYLRPNRAFVPSEVEVILRTNSHRQGWAPMNGFGNGTYHTLGGTIGIVKNDLIEIHTPAWQDALDTDNGVKKTAPSAPPAANANPPASTPNAPGTAAATSATTTNAAPTSPTSSP